MPFTPVIPASGLAGWNFLKSSLDTQTEIFNRSPDIQRDIDYFTANIGSVESLDDFMADRRLLKVVLGAFGLSDEINKGAFVRKILEEGAIDSQSFAVRLNNSDYLDLARSFVVGEDGQLSVDEGTAAQVAAQYQTEVFEVEVGNVDNAMRLALNFERDIADLARRDLSENAGWFKAMASIPIRTVLEGAFNLPEGFSQLDLDRQKDILSDKAYSLFGGKTVDIFDDPEVIETTIRRFLLRRQIEQGPSASTSGFAAIAILNGGLGSAGITNLLLSNI
jgi:hypothetical protein